MLLKSVKREWANTYVSTSGMEELEAEARCGTKHIKWLFPIHFLFWTNILLFFFLECCNTTTLPVKLQLTGHYFSRNNVSGNSTVLPPGTFPAEYPQIHLC